MSENEDLPIWTIDSSDYVINDRFLKLRRDSCTTPQGGKVGTYYVLELKDWINCIAIDKDANVMMLRHYRHGVQKYLMEFIGGGMEEGETPEEAAKREVEEETGYTGGSIFHVGTSYPNPANHTNQVHTYLVVNGEINQDQNLEVGETITVEKIPLKTVIEEMSKPDSVYPAIYIAALFHAMNFIRASGDSALEHLKKYITTV
jgi:8-oxo-dGTP pyrophosphatase MutT (NUDIX family)